MLNTEMNQEVRSNYQAWLSQEWNRCSSLRGAFENHAVTYLVTTNGGGAAAVIAFAGSAAYVNIYVYLVLAAFLLGLLLAGVAIAVGYHRMSFITRTLGDDHRAFNKGELRSRALEENHRNRFKKHLYGEWCGWISFLLFGLGISGSAYTFADYVTEKAEKVMKEKAMALKPSPAQTITAPTTIPTASKPSK